MKRTAARRISRRRHIARQQDAFTFRVRVHLRHGGNQRLRVGMFRLAQQRLRLGRFHHLAQIHHHHTAADVLHHRQIMRDEQIRDAVRLLQILKQVHDLRLHRNVQRAHRFVANDELRLDRQRAGDADALPLTAAEFMRITLRMDRVEADCLQ